jgi:hypothetical protein
MNYTTLTGLNTDQIKIISKAIKISKTVLGRPSKLTTEEEIILTLVYLKINMTTTQLAALFNISQSTSWRIIRRIIPLLAALLNPKWPSKLMPLLVDGTLIPTQDRRVASKCRNYRFSVNIQVVSTLDGRILLTSEARPGKSHDGPISRELLPDLSDYIVLTDRSYIKTSWAWITPKRNEEFNDIHVKFRARIEHYIGRLKTWMVLRQCRLRGIITLVVQAVSAIFNLKYKNDF